ncbi:MAG: O-acetylhomoserine aminocarboxypropyltransferase/cysteine synthase [Coriobacteriales bacterium]|jgi:O-acetylhomoserine (thiol)-lyase|nr:O-acetylhomoserine aminocarboxypropyltransferase/cysteine synthase [Coriobacteriales bacterium]
MAIVTDTSKWAFETKQIHIGQEIPDPTTDSRAVPIYQTSSYVFPSSAVAANRFVLTDLGNIYTRIMNPTSDVFEKRVAALEGGLAGLAVASGAAAITYAVQNITRAGDHIVADKYLYGGTYNLFVNTLQEFGVETSLVDSFDIQAVKDAIRENTKLIFVESLGNPNSTVADIESLANVAHEAGIPLIVDNTFATPYLLRPIEYGADIVVHSATKFIGGHGTSVGGIIIDSGNFDWQQNDKFPGLSQPCPSYHGVVFADAVNRAGVGNIPYIIRARVTLLRDTGASLAPLNAFLFLQGLETLSLRVERHIQNTQAVIDYLVNHPKVAKVNHPSIAGRHDNALYQKYFPNGGGSIFTFELNGTALQALKFTEDLELFSLLANVADVKSLVIHPASTTHSQQSTSELAQSGITPTTIRLSIGTENIKDIIEDLQQAFDKIS